MNSKKFLDLNSKDQNFFNGYVPLKPLTFCIVIVYDTNYQTEIYGIENPWAYMKEVKKNPRVKATWIKGEEKFSEPPTCL